MDHVEIGGTIRLKSIYDPRGMDHVEIGGTSQSVICNLSHFCAKFTSTYMRRLLNFGGIYYVIKNIISFIHDLFNKRFMVDWINYLVHFKKQEINNQIKTRGFYSLFSFFARKSHALI